MDRRLFLTGLLGVAGTAALATAMPRPANAALGDPLEDLRPPRPDEGVPEWELAEEPEEEGIEVAQRGEWRPRRGGRGRRGRWRRRGRRWRGRRGWRRYGRRRYRRPYWRRRRRFRYWDDGYYGGYRGRCRWYVNRWGEWVRRCYRRPPFGFGIWF